MMERGQDQEWTGKKTMVMVYVEDDPVRLEPGRQRAEKNEEAASVFVHSDSTTANSN